MTFPCLPLRLTSIRISGLYLDITSCGKFPCSSPRVSAESLCPQIPLPPAPALLCVVGSGPSEADACRPPLSPGSWGRDVEGRRKGRDGASLSFLSASGALAAESPSGTHSLWLHFPREETLVGSHPTAFCLCPSGRSGSCFLQLLTFHHLLGNFLCCHCLYKRLSDSVFLPHMDLPSCGAHSPSPDPPDSS